MIHLVPGQTFRETMAQRLTWWEEEDRARLARLAALADGTAPDGLQPVVDLLRLHARHSEDAAQ